MGPLDWMGTVIVVGVVLFLAWCFDLIGLLRTGDAWWLHRLRKRRMKAEPQEKDNK